MKKVSILIPCLNEERGVGRVIDDIPTDLLRSLGYQPEVIVIDNNSTDGTIDSAKRRNVRVISEKRPGKGNAIRAGFEALDQDTSYIVMLDGDNTYKSREIPRLIEPLASNFCDVVVGSRLGGKMGKNSFRFSNRLANWGYTFLVRQFYQANITDVLSGYFAWRREVVDKLKFHLQSDGFAIEMEMITKIVKLGYEIYSVPITYDEREGKTKINLIQDGARILFMFIKNLFWSV